MLDKPTFKRDGIRAAIGGVIVWALLVTILRGLRYPNDFAEAHWLIDYRFGYIKRGFIGSILTIFTTLLQLDQSEAMIRSLSYATFLLFSLALILAMYRILHRSGWSSGAFLTISVFVTSPYIVMASHLNGYYDGLLIVITFAAAWLVHNDHPWVASILAGVAVLSHEAYMLIGFPVLLLACYLKSQTLSSRLILRHYYPLLLPAMIFVVTVLVSMTLIDSESQRQLLSTYLRDFNFIHRDRHSLVPRWLTTSLLEYLQSQVSRLPRRLSDTEITSLILPTVSTILFFLFSSFQLRLKSIQGAIILFVTFIPLAMHAVAWDTARIWSYVIITSFASAWLYFENRPTTGYVNPSLIAILAFPALLVNVFGAIPLMDNQTEHFGRNLRFLLYSPLFAGVFLSWLLAPYHSVIRKRSNNR